VSFGSTDIFLSGWEDKDKKGILVLFVDHLRSQKLNIRMGMAALRNLFRSCLEDVSIFSDPCVMGAREACRPDPREVSLAKEFHLRLPVPFELVARLRENCWNGDYDIDSRMTYLGVVLASYSLCLRIGEYAHDSNSKGKHCIKNEDVYFLCNDGVQRFRWELRSSQDIEISIARRFFTPYTAPYMAPYMAPYTE